MARKVKDQQKTSPPKALDGGPRFNEQMSKEELLDWAFRCRDRSKGFYEEIWKEFDYFCKVNAADSLSDADKETLRDTKRPEIDPPFAAGVVEAVVGAEISQQVEPVFHGVDRGLEDEVIAEWLTQLLRNGFNLTQANDKLLDCFKDKLVGGYGFAQFYIDLHRIPFRIACKKLPFWTVWPDPDAIEPNLRDARFWWVETTWSLEDAQANWSSEEQRGALEGAATKAGRGAAGVLPASPNRVGGKKRGDESTVVIAEFQYRRAVARARYADPETDEEVDSTREEYEERKKELNDAADAQMEEYTQAVEEWSAMAANPDPMLAQQAGPQPQAPQPPRVDDAFEAEFVVFYNGYSFRRAFIAGESKDTGSVLEDKEIDLPLPGDEPGFTIKCDTGYDWQMREDERVRRYGLMRKIVHIQEWFVKFIVNYIELMGRKIKGGGTVEKGAFEGIPGGFNKFVQNSSKGGAWHMVADGAHAQGKINPWPAAQGEPGLVEGINIMREMFGWVTGVSQAMQGTMTSDRSNVLTENLQQHGLQMLLPVRQPRQSFLLSCGRLYAAIAIKHLPAEELDRILGVQEIEGMTVQKQMDPATGQPVLGPGGKPVMTPIVSETDGQPVTAGKILKNVDLLDYDLQADLSPTNQTEKMKFVTVWNQHGLGKILADALPGAAGTAIWLPRLFRNLPLPASDAKAMASEAEKLLETMQAAETAEGIVAAFTQIMQSDPGQAQQIHQQLMGMLQPQGEEGGQEQMM